MLRAYTADRKESWAEWIFLLEHAYNSNIHTSMGTSPYYLLYGFNPRSPLDILADTGVKGRSYSASPKAENFLTSLAMEREAARVAIAAAQDKQTRSHNKG
jgi:hypothetical protein